MVRRILIAIGYTVLTIFLVAGTFLLVAYGNDYSYDFNTHKVIQNGHIIIDSLPTGITVTADNKVLKHKTPYQAAYKVGFHSFSLGKDGFITWHKVLQVIAGRVTLARYVIMMPVKPEKKTLDTKSQVVAESISKDHRHLAYVTGGPDQAVYTLDLGNPKPVKLYAPPAVTPATPAETLTGVTWSDEASHVLISSTADGQPVYRLAAASGGEPANLTDQFKMNFSGMQFSDSNWRQLYWISADGLRRLDTDSQTVSPVLADNVSQFWVIPGDRVLYVQQTELGRSLWSLDGHGHHQELIQALAESESYSVAYTSYNGADELAVVPSKTQTGTLYTGIFGDTPVAKVIAKEVAACSFSPDGHLLVFSAPSKMLTYDLEQSELNNRFVSYEISDQPGSLSALSWYDNYHLLANRGGELYWSEYDGANRVDIGPVSSNFPAYGSADLKSLVYFKPEAQAVKVVQEIIKP